MRGTRAKRERKLGLRKGPAERPKPTMIQKAEVLARRQAAKTWTRSERKPTIRGGTKVVPCPIDGKLDCVENDHLFAPQAAE